MKRFHDELKDLVNAVSQKSISRTQLTRILNTLDYNEFNQLNQEFFGIEISKNEWNAIDGKELRGSIDGVAGEKRGESIVLSVCHKSKLKIVLGYYSGKKDSEKIIVENFFDEYTDLKDKKFTLDALHNSEKLLTMINSKSALYLTQIKGNQKFMLEDIIDFTTNSEHDLIVSDIEKGHGRIDKRKYKVYTVDCKLFDKRWCNSGIKTIIKVKRESYNCKKQKWTSETSYYISNYEKDLKELTIAIRKHWSVEVMNRVRDVNFGEDNLKSKLINVQRNFSSLLTQIINKLSTMNIENNFNILREDLVHDKRYTTAFFNKIL